MKTKLSFQASEKISNSKQYSVSIACPLSDPAEDVTVNGSHAGQR